MSRLLWLGVRHQANRIPIGGTCGQGRRGNCPCLKPPSRLLPPRVREIRPRPGMSSWSSWASPTYGACERTASKPRPCAGRVVHRVYDTLSPSGEEQVARRNRARAVNGDAGIPALRHQDPKWVGRCSVSAGATSGQSNRCRYRARSALHPRSKSRLPVSLQYGGLYRSHPLCCPVPRAGPGRIV